MTTTKGLGENGKTLKQMMDENDRLYRETGCYAGVTDLQVLSRDPIKAELFHSRILSSLISGRETCRMVSGSPFVREVAELCVGLYTPDGDNIAQSTGIQVHIKLMGDNIKWMINKNYEEEVGINDGDFFIANDPVISGMHAADVYDILPVFHKGELVAWVCTVIMEMDIGAVSPGCMPTANVERGTDGLKFCCERIGSNDKLNRDFEFKIENSLDMHDIFLLDRKGAIAANIKVREEMKNMIDEFGIDYFKDGMKELIEDERRNQIARIKQRMIPGIYRSMVPAEFPMAKQPVAWVPAKKDTIRAIPIRMDVTLDGHITLDFEGTGEWGWHPFNATPMVVDGGISIVTVQTLSFDGRGNLGSLLPITAKKPTVDSLLNPSQIKKLATSTPWAPILDMFGMWTCMLGYAYYIRGFQEETFNYRSSAGWQMAGYDQLGNKRPLMAAGTGNFGPGACGVIDGVDCGGWLATPEVDQGSVEIWELFVPHMEMARRFEPYSIGYGKFRSGCAIPTCTMIHNTQLLVASAALGTASDGIIPNLGMFGGYCGGRRNTIHVHFDNIQEMIREKKPLLHELGDLNDLEERIQEMGGTIVDHGLLPAPFEVSEGDYLIAGSGSGGGVGDPIERDLDIIKTDLDNGLCTKWQAENCYCVEADYNEASKEWTINADESEKIRIGKRKQRLDRAIPVKEWWKKAREKVMAKDMDDKLVEMYQSSARISEPFVQDIKEFWALPEDFSL